MEFLKLCNKFPKESQDIEIPFIILDPILSKVKKRWSPPSETLKQLCAECNDPWK